MKNLGVWVSLAHRSRKKGKDGCQRSMFPHETRCNRGLSSHLILSPPATFLYGETGCTCICFNTEPFYSQPNMPLCHLYFFIKQCWAYLPELLFPWCWIYSVWQNHTISESIRYQQVLISGPSLICKDSLGYYVKPFLGCGVFMYGSICTCNMLLSYRKWNIDTHYDRN